MLAKVKSWKELEACCALNLNFAQKICYQSLRLLKRSLVTCGTTLIFRIFFMAFLTEEEFTLTALTWISNNILAEVAS